MTTPPLPSVRATLSEECGLGLPRRRWVWPPDPHLLAAVAVAPLVWVMLALFGSAWLIPPAGLWAWASLVGVQPVLEELVFRGVLQGQALRLTHGRRLGPLSMANLMVSALFAVLHLPTQALLPSLAVLLPSLIFGHVRERFGSVWPAVGLHVYYNAGLAITAWLASTQ